MNRYIFAFTALGLFFLSSTQARAQEKEDKEYNESVIMRSSFSPVVSEAYKLSIKPTVFESDFEMPSFQYDRTSVRYPTAVHFDKIKPAKVKGEPIARLYNTHLRAAFGSYFTSLADASYSNTRSKDLIYGVSFRHRSSLGQIEDYANSSYATNRLNLYGKKIWDDFAVEVKADYQHQRHYYYGFSDTLDIEKEDYRNSFHSVGGEVSYYSLYREEDKFHNYASFSVRHTFGNWDRKETDFLFTVGANKLFSLFGQEQQKLGLDITYNQIVGSYKPEAFPARFSPDAILQNTSNNVGSVDIRAFMNFKVDRFKVHATLSFVPSFGDKKEFYFLPTVVIDFPQLAQSIDLSAGIKSNHTTPTLLSIAKENPYISPLANMSIVSSTSIFAKAIYTNPNGINASLEAGYQTINDQYFYTLDSYAQLNNMFILHYDDAKRLYADLNFGYSKDNINLGVNLLYQNLNTETLEAAWYTPAFKASLFVEYTAADKLSIAIIPAFSSQVRCLNENGEVVKLKSKIDLNLTASYRYSDQLIIFTELNNLAFQRYYTYYNYPTQKFVGLLGLRFAF